MLAALALAACAATPARAAALTYDDFRSATTDGIVKLCTAPETDPLYQGAVGYCIGYLTGAFHYHRASAGPDVKLFCMSSPEPSRRESIEKFVAWTKKHPEYGHDLAVDTMFRFLAEEHPCKGDAR